MNYFGEVGRVVLRLRKRKAATFLLCSFAEALTHFEKIRKTTLDSLEKKVSQMRRKKENAMSNYRLTQAFLQTRLGDLVTKSDKFRYRIPRCQFI